MIADRQKQYQQMLKGIGKKSEVNNNVTYEDNDESQRRVFIKDDECRD